MKTITQFFATVDAIEAAAPKLSNDERAAYDKICKRLHRATTDRRRAAQQGDAQKLAAAERALTRARDARDTLVGPHVGHLWAPVRIIQTFEAAWHGPSGSGIHRHTCEMVLDHKDLSGPGYRIVRVLTDEGGPPTNSRVAPSTMGIAWHALDRRIKDGTITVVGEEEPS